MAIKAIARQLHIPQKECESYLRHNSLKSETQLPCVWENEIGDDFMNDLRLFKLLYFLLSGELCEHSSNFQVLTERYQELEHVGQFKF